VVAERAGGGLGEGDVSFNAEVVKGGWGSARLPLEGRCFFLLRGWHLSASLGRGDGPACPPGERTRKGRRLPPQISGQTESAPRRAQKPAQTKAAWHNWQGRQTDPERDARVLTDRAVLTTQLSLRVRVSLWAKTHSRDRLQACRQHEDDPRTQDPGPRTQDRPKTLV
jgi:hypothetical protein